MYSKLLLLSFLFFFTACTKDGNKYFSEEIQNGAWLFERVLSENGNTILDGAGEPKIILIFYQNDSIAGRVVGEYTLTDTDTKLFLRAEIDSTHWYYNDEFVNYPQRYYDFEDIVHDGVSGTVEYYEAGYDSRFSFQYEDDRVMWFRRY